VEGIIVVQPHGSNSHVEAEVVTLLERRPQLTIKEVAAELGKSVRMLQLALVAEHGNYREIRRRCRMRVAMKMLSETALPIVQISRHAGYANPANFHRAFTAVAGTTPGQFRRDRQRQQPAAI
jgi:AraC-like DNA-binding protein